MFLYRLVRPNKNYATSLFCKINRNIEKISWNIQHVLPIRILVTARNILSVSNESNLINMTVEKIFFPMYRNMRLYGIFRR